MKRNVLIKLVLCFTALFHSQALCDEFEVEQMRLQQIITHFFPSEALESFEWHHLSGGYSDASNYKIEGPSCEQSYVIRFHQPSQSLQDVKREFWAFQQAAKRNVAPRVHGVWLDQKALLTDFQKARTITVKQAQDSEVISAVAKAFRSVHDIPKNRITNQSIANVYRQRALRVPSTTFTLEALEIVNSNIEKLAELPPNSRTLHGDPNPRNIFINSDGVKFIDWTETTWDDSFFDLSYFALLLDYNREQVEKLLNAYLGRDPSPTDWERYLLTENVNLAGFSIILHTTALATADGPLTEEKSLCSWSFYAERFANGDKLSAQDVYDWSKAGLQKAKNLR